MHRLDRGERNNKVAGVLDVHDELGATLRGHLTNRAKFLAPVGNEGLKPYLDLLLHDPSSPSGANPKFQLLGLARSRHRERDSSYVRTNSVSERGGTEARSGSPSILVARRDPDRLRRPGKDDG